MDRLDDSSRNLLIQSNEFALPDFIGHGANFDPFGVLIPGDTIPMHGTVSVPGYIDGTGGMDDGQFGPIPEDIFGFNDLGFQDSNFALHGLPSFTADMKKGELEDDIDDDDDDEEDYSSATTANMNSANTTPSPRTPNKKTKGDRSRTLVSERRRRGRMKEKLYALRALVPNITKMDKASIVGDAVLYVQDLQLQAKKLKAEIAGLEASLAGPQNNPNGQPGSCNSKKINQATKIMNPAPRKILQMDLFRVEERGFYVRLVSNKGVGVAASLYKALESLTSFNVRSSNLASSSSAEQFILTFTLNIREGDPMIDVPNLRLWITGSLLNQGFELMQTV